MNLGVVLNLVSKQDSYLSLLRSLIVGLVLVISGMFEGGAAWNYLVILLD